MIHRPLPWKPIAIVTSMTTILLSLLLLPACCCVRGPGTTAQLPPVMHIPPIGTEPIPTPKEAEAKAPTDAEMHNVDFRMDEFMFLRIHHLRGTMQSKQPGAPLNFDDKTSFVMKVDTAEVGMTPPSLDRLMNAYVFNYPNPPLRDLKISIEGKQLVQSGIMHKIVDIPFTMWANVSATNGKIRLHPTKISICGINGLGLLKAVGMTMEKMLTLPKDRGVSAEGNDLLLDPSHLLPPPQIELKLSGVRIEGNELIQEFDAGMHLPPIVPRHPNEKNWMYYRHGTLRMGKLLMVDADMEVTDTDPSDPFDFFIDRYNDQLVAGFSRNQPNYALFVYMRDFEDVGTPPKPGERLAP
ncbi:MAG TPA: hypothetical protein VJ901_22795 [Thermoanaerobaculia bacterium]|nr:hypothetical protein [Thermoanaerobaculia bacterium]